MPLRHLPKLNYLAIFEKWYYFYDEILSHYIWHLRLIRLSALLIYRQWQNPFIKQRSDSFQTDEVQNIIRN